MKKIKEGFMLREIAGNSIVVPVGAASVDFNGMITLNEVGAFLWKELINGATKEQLCQAVLDNYDTTSVQAETDINEFLRSLSESNLLEEA